MKNYKRLSPKVKILLLDDCDDALEFLFMRNNKAVQRYLNSREFYNDLVTALHEAQAWVKGEADARVSIWSKE